MYQSITAYPTTTGTYGQGKYTSGEALFASKFSSAGNLLYSTLIPAVSNNISFMPALGGLVVGPQGSAYLTGYAQAGLPVTDTSNQPTNGAEAGFLLELSSDATALTFSRYLPGANTAYGLALASDGTLYLTG